MKVGIISHYLHFGYGGVLQNYALQTVLKQMGLKPITLRVSVVKDKGLSNSIRNFVARIVHYFMNIESGVTKKQDEYISKHIEPFIKKYIDCTTPIDKTKDFSKAILRERCEAVIVGSDQIWRNNFDYVDECFLGFIQEPKIRKISYAASFGIDDWCFSKGQTLKYRNYIQDFFSVSVREESGLKLCRDYLDRKDAVLVLDPTLLLDKSAYTKLVEDANENKMEGNLFTYILDKSPQKESVINHIAECLSMKRFECMPKYESTYSNVKRHRNECVYPPITKWLRSFIDAELVITDSFHGTVFSIIFNKNFYVILNEERGIARFISLLNLFGLQNRIISEKTVIDYNAIDIDWDVVNKERQCWINKSLSFIRESLL